MKSALRWALLGGAIWLLVLGGNTAAIAQSSGSARTRESLKTITDKFFTALEAHKPFSLPLASGVKYTENGMQTTKGGTIQGVEMPAHKCSPKGFADMNHPPRRFLVDVETGTVRRCE